MVTLRDTFLDDFNNAGKKAVLRLLASDILGSEQYELLVRRYDDMSRNFDCVTADGKKKNRYKNDSTAQVWTFYEGVKPHRRIDTKGEYYQDTCSVKIPISHPFFSKLRPETIEKYSLDGAVIGLDLPTWFNLQSDKRVMIVAQDPLRDPEWYHECKEAICSSPFGLHGREWREDGRGGRRMTLLVDKLINDGCGVYLTDAYKYFLKGWKDGKGRDLSLTQEQETLRLYRDIIKKEIEIVHPDVIVCLGEKASKALTKIDSGYSVPVLSMTHFSGSAQGFLLAKPEYIRIKKMLNLTDDSVETQASVYAFAIVNGLEI